MSLVPKISTGGIIAVLKSPEVMAVGAAVLLAGTLTAHVTGMLAKFVPAQYMTWAIIGLSLIVLLIATKIQSKVFRAILIGFAGANVFVAVAPFVQQNILSRFA